MFTTPAPTNARELPVAISNLKPSSENSAEFTPNPPSTWIVVVTDVAKIAVTRPFGTMAGFQFAASLQFALTGSASHVWA